MTKQQLQDKAKLLLEFFDGKDNGYMPDHSKRMFEVNVKRHGKRWENDRIDIEDMINKEPKRYHKALREFFTDDHINWLSQDWLDTETMFFLDNFKSKGHNQFTSKQWWLDNVMVKIDADEPTGYPYLDKIKTKGGKKRELVKWITKDDMMLTAFSYVDEYGLYGRMGGHFCFDISYDYEPLVSVEEWGKAYSYDNNFKMTIGEARDIIIEAEKAQLAVERIKEYVRNEADSLSFRVRVEDAIAEKISEIKHEEKEARRERKELARKAKETKYTNITLGDLLQAVNTTAEIRGLAQGILKLL